MSERLNLNVGGVRCSLIFLNLEANKLLTFFISLLNPYEISLFLGRGHFLRVTVKGRIKVTPKTFQ